MKGSLLDMRDEKEKKRKNWRFSSECCRLLGSFGLRVSSELAVNTREIMIRTGFLSRDKGSRSRTLNTLDVYARVAHRNRRAEVRTVAPCGNIISRVVSTREKDSVSGICDHPAAARASFSTENYPDVSAKPQGEQASVIRCKSWVG